MECRKVQIAQVLWQHDTFSQRSVFSRERFKEEYGAQKDLLKQPHMQQYLRTTLLGTVEFPWWAWDLPESIYQSLSLESFPASHSLTVFYNAKYPTTHEEIFTLDLI